MNLEQRASSLVSMLTQYPLTVITNCRFLSYFSLSYSLSQLCTAFMCMNKTRPEKIGTKVKQLMCIQNKLLLLMSLMENLHFQNRMNLPSVNGNPIFSKQHQASGDLQVADLVQSRKSTCFRMRAVRPIFKYDLLITY